MRALTLLRHSLTEGNERRLYYGSTDLPLSPAGRALAERAREGLALPDFGLYITSSMARADETLRLLTGHEPDFSLFDLREMRFGAFEMRGYNELKDDPDYQRWIEDRLGDGTVRCPGGESPREFRDRVLRGGQALLEIPWQTALAVVHGGVIVKLMQDWFPGEDRHFYQWQPGPCGGYRVQFNEQTPVCFEPVGLSGGD